MRLVEFTSTNGQRHVGRVEENGDVLRVLKNASRVYDLALEAGQSGTTLEAVVENHLGEQTVDYKQASSSAAGPSRSSPYARFRYGLNPPGQRSGPR